MLHVNRISYSSEKNLIYPKKRDLSTWIKDYDLQSYSTQEIQEEIKELLLDVYNKDEDIRDHFLKKYVKGFSEILDEQSRPRNMESIFKDITFNIPEKSEFKIFIENRNKKLENNKKKNYNYYNINKNNWSLNKKFKNNRNNDNENNKEEKKDYDDKDDDELGKKNNYKKNKGNKSLDFKKRDNSKIRNYVKYRNQVLKRYSNIFDGIEIKNNNINILNIPPKNIIKDDKENKDNNLGQENISQKKNSSLMDFRHSNLNKHNNRSYYDIPRLNNKNKKNEKKGIKIYSKSNIEVEEKNISNNDSIYEKKIINNNDGFLYEKKIVINKGEPTEEDNLYNQISNWKELNKKNKKTVLNDLYLNDNLNINKERNEYNFNEIKKNNELMEFIHDTIKDSQEINVKNSGNIVEREEVHNGNELEEDSGEVKKINISGVNYKLTGDPKKVEVYEEIIKDTNNLEKSKNKNEESSLFHKKIIIEKNFDIKDMNVNGNIKIDVDNGENINYIQKIEKDIKESKIRIRNINIPKDAFFKKNQGRNLKNFFDFNREANPNKSYEIRNNKIIEINNFYFDSNESNDKNFDIKNKTTNNLERNNYYYPSTLNSESDNKKYIKIYKGKKIIENGNKFNINNNRKKEENKITEVKINLNTGNKNINNINRNKEIKEIKIVKKDFNNDNVYNNTYNINNKKGAFHNGIIKNDVNIEEIKKRNYTQTNINNNEANDPTKINSSGTKRKRFHRVANKEIS